MQIPRDYRTPGQQNQMLPDLNANLGSQLKMYGTKGDMVPRDTSDTSTMPSSAFQGRDINMLPNLKSIVSNKRIPAFNSATKAQNRLQSLKKTGNTGVYNSPDYR